MQEVFVKLYLAGDNFKDETHLKAWLIRVTINRCKDMAMLSFKRKQITVDSVHAIAEDFSQRDKEILSAVCSLKPEYRDVVYLFYYEGYTISETARLLNKNINTVNSQLQRARKKLGELIEEVAE